MQSLHIVGRRQVDWVEVADPEVESGAEAVVQPVAVASCDLDITIVEGHDAFPPPFPIGHEFVARVVEVGRDVTVAAPGDLVIVPFQISCGRCELCRRGISASCTAVPGLAMYGMGQLTGGYPGAMADLVKVPFADGMLVPLPAGVDPVAVASMSDNIPDAWRTVAPLERYPGGRVLIVSGGTGGSVGLYAVGLAMALGASSVTYVDIEADRLELAERLGATVREGPPAKRYDQAEVTVDASGAHHDALLSAIRSTVPGGTCTSIGIYWDRYTPMPLNTMYGIGLNFVTGRANARADLSKALELVAAGAFHPELVTAAVAGWDDAPTAWVENTRKLVVQRAG